MTRGKPELTNVKSYAMEENEVLKIAASLETYSEHHLAKPIVEEAKVKKLEFLAVKDFEAVAGKGVKGKLVVAGEEVLGVIGNRALMKEANISSANFEEDIIKLESEGKTVVVLALDNKIKGLLAVADTLKEESKQAVEWLKKGFASRKSSKGKRASKNRKIGSDGR